MNATRKNKGYVTASFTTKHRREEEMQMGKLKEIRKEVVLREEENQH